MNIHETYNGLTKALPNYRKRLSQLKMVEAIDSCFKETNPLKKDGHNLCLVEAPTGTGKSLAYLLAGVINAKLINKKLVISTATKTLQSQLIEKDIPNFINHSNIKFSYSLAKGRNNYLCLYQLDLSLSGVSNELLPDSNSSRDILLKIQNEFDKGDWDGDLDDINIRIDSKVKSQITISKDSCLGYSCSYNQKDSCKCPFYKKREELKSNEVIVTNHSLLLADLMLGGGVVLPIKSENYLLCIDEGHTFADTAINSFTQNFELKHAIASCEQLSKLIFNKQTNSYISIDIALCHDLANKVDELITILSEFLILLGNNLEIFVKEQLILNEYLNPKLGSEFRDRFINFVLLSGDIQSGLNLVIENLKEQIKVKPDFMIENNLNRLGFYLSIIERILETANYIINQDDSRYNANAKWIDIVKKKEEVEFIINSRVTHVGRLLFDKLWSKVYGAAITSATLAVGNNFNYYLSKLGLNLYSQVKTHKLETEFAYSHQAQIVVPRFRSAPDYKNRDEFDKELVDYLNKALAYADSYGTLVLFFNKQQLETVYSKLISPVQKRILLQTDYFSNQKLIDEHKKLIDADRPSVVFGLNSFAEGVDLPSYYCLHVIITKLPFETPKDPQSMVEEYWVNFEKGSYFNEVALPEACIRFIQAAGRLIRHESDYGQLTVCDNRLITKNYGSLLLNALPSFNRRYNSAFIDEAFTKVKA